MNKEEFKEFFNANKNKFVSGIYNYCDRWCERCTMTSRCSLYAMEKQDQTVDSNNLNKTFEKVEQHFQIVFEMLKDYVKEQNIDLSTIDNEAFEEEEEQKAKRVNNHQLAQAAKNYSTISSNWLKSHEELFKRQEETLIVKDKMGMTDAADQKKVIEINDSLDIIMWYNHQIYIKIIRALRGLELDFDDEDTIQNDCNGSARVALIGVDRSLGAWHQLYELFPDKEDDLIKILLLLTEIRKDIHTAFPNVLQFIRPGFDE